MYIKIHKKGESTVIALCDQDLIGKRFEQNNLQLDINERFYKGEIKTEEEIIKILKNAPIINIVGKKAIKLASKNNIISKENIIKIQGVPHAQFV